MATTATPQRVFVISFESDDGQGNFHCIVPEARLSETVRADLLRMSKTSGVLPVREHFDLPGGETARLFGYCCHHADPEGGAPYDSEGRLLNNEALDHFITGDEEPPVLGPDFELVAHVWVEHEEFWSEECCACVDQ